MCGNTSCDALLCVVAQVTFCSCPTTDGELPDCLPVLGRLHTDTSPSTGVYPGKYGRWDRGTKEETPVRAAESLPRTTATDSRGDADSGWSRR